jgi:hypothetical protein
MDPPRQVDGFADIAKAKCGAAVGAVGVHDQAARYAKYVEEMAGPRFTGVKAFVNPRGRR